MTAMTETFTLKIAPDNTPIKSRMATKKYDIAFLHTSALCVKNFDAIMAELAPELSVKHEVRPHFLSRAHANGIDRVLEGDVTAAIEALSQKSKVVVVTCSYIGQVAENIGMLNGSHIESIDRAMADFAVERANNILVLTALQSTLKPTRELLKSSMNHFGVKPTVTLQYVDDAWEHFLSGNEKGYYEDIAKVLREKEQDYDLIMLAQSSMAGVVDGVELSIPVISSPRIGVERAIQFLAPR